MFSKTRKDIKDALSDDFLVVLLASSTTDLEKTINRLCLRFRDLLKFTLPELEHSLSVDKILKLIGKEREELLKLSGVTSEQTMGKPIDNEQLKSFAHAIEMLQEEKHNKERYIREILTKIMPNTLEVAGQGTACKILTLAGSLRNLAFMPASKIQLLGAEKSLFRHLTKGTKSPKHGVIHEHPIVNSAKNKGKAARVVADKISIAAKVDYFKGEYIADKLNEALKKSF